MPKLAAHFERTGTDLTFICSKWLLCVFCDILPSETTLRVWDCVFSEGSKIFFRVALALLYQNQDELMKTSDIGNIMRILQGACHRAHDADSLMKFAFDSIGGFPMSKITHLREEASIEVAEGQRQKDEKLASYRESSTKS